VTPLAIRLAAALADRLDSVVPRPLNVRAELATVSRYDGTEWCGTSDVGGIIDQDVDGDWPVSERAATAAWGVLNAVQDFVAETLRTEWPVLATGGMALPDARTDGAYVYVWYGESEDRPAMSFDPIPLDSPDDLT
jgi:hypothetical protein